MSSRVLSPQVISYILYWCSWTFSRCCSFLMATTRFFSFSHMQPHSSFQMSLTLIWYSQTTCCSVTVWAVIGWKKKKRGHGRIFQAQAECNTAAEIYKAKLRGKCDTFTFQMKVNNFAMHFSHRCVHIHLLQTARSGPGLYSTPRVKTRRCNFYWMMATVATRDNYGIIVKGKM